MSNTSVLIGGLPEKARLPLAKALDMSFGEGVVDIHDDEDINSSLEMDCINASTDTSVLYVILSSTAKEFVSHSYRDIDTLNKLYVYNGNLSDFISWLEDTFDIELPLNNDSSDDSNDDEVDSKQVGDLLYQNSVLLKKLEVEKNKVKQLLDKNAQLQESLKVSENRYLSSIGNNTTKESSLSYSIDKVELIKTRNVIPNLTVCSAATPVSEDFLTHYVQKLVQNNDKLVVLDLMTPTYVDYTFKIKKVVSCVPWLRGELPFNDVIMTSDRFHNKVLSLGFSRVNFEWLVSLDWYKLIKELSANVVVLIGSLSSDYNLQLFTKLSSLSSLTPTIISRGSPLNIRNTNLMLSSIKYAVKVIFEEVNTKGYYENFDWPSTMIVEEVLSD